MPVSVLAAAPCLRLQHLQCNPGLGPGGITCLVHAAEGRAFPGPTEGLVPSAGIRPREITHSKSRKSLFGGMGIC